MVLFLQQFVNGLAKGGIYALVAVGFALIYSVLKFSNFAHGGVLSVTAYMAYFSTVIFQLKNLRGFGMLITLVVVAILGGLIEVLFDIIGFTQLRKRKSPRIFHFVCAITLGILCMNVITYFFGSRVYVMPRFFSTVTFKIGGVIIFVLDAMAFGVSIILIVLLTLLINKTRLGLAMRTVAMDDLTAPLMGISTTTVIRISYFIAGALAGVAGVFLATNYSIDPFVGNNMIVKGFYAAIIGGLGSLPGAVMGAFFLAISEVILTNIVGDINAPIVLFAFLLVFLMIRPRGILGIIAQEKA